MGVAFVLALALTTGPTARASIVYSGVENIVVNYSNPSYALDFNGDSTTDLTFKMVRGTGGSGDVDTSSEITLAPNAVIGSGVDATALSSGTSISSADSFISGSLILGVYSFNGSVSSPIGGQFANAGDAYLGVEFEIGNSLHYGWVLLNDSGQPYPNGQTLTIKGWAYDTVAGEAISAGETRSPAVPEPASLLQLAMGSAGLAGLSALRLRRKKKTV